MRVEKANIVLDEAAERIYQMLGGLDFSDRVKVNITQPVDSGAELIGSLMEQEHQLDLWRRSLVELGILIGSFLQGARSREVSEIPEQEIRTIIDYLTASVNQIPDNDGSVLIRFRGRQQNEMEKQGEALDYVLQSGHVVVDMNKAQRLQDSNNSTPRLPGRLRNAFAVFDRLAINNIRLSIGARSAEEIERLHLSLQMLFRFFNAIAPTVAVNREEIPQQGTDRGIFNEYQRLDPNLTLLADINGLNKESVQEVVVKVDDIMRRQDAPAELVHYFSVYDAVFAFKKFKDQLVKPMVEVNSIRWLLVGNGRKSIPSGKAQLIKTVARLYAATPKKIGQVLESIYNSDFRDILPAELHYNMATVVKFLNSLEGIDTNPAVSRETIDTFKQGLDRAPETLLDNLTIADDRLATHTEKGETVSGKVHFELLAMLSFFKKRGRTKKKLRQMLQKEIDLSAQDLDIIARDFGIGTEEAARLISLLKECFTSAGRFYRRPFEKNIPAFLKHEKKIFGFLWHYLKELRFREDRVSFLNSLQLLIAQMDQPQLALEVLLLDFIHSPRSVSFSDRNALILANILLRKYNKELNNFIENTPEEVLLVNEGLDRKMTARAAKLIDQDHERYLRKVRTLHNKLLEAVKLPEEGVRPIPLRYLISVEREIFILLSLVGGRAAHKIMQSVVAEYGNPSAHIYTLISNQDQMKAVFQLLQLTVRGLLRFNDINDLPVLERIKGQEWMFVELNPELLTKEMITRVMEYVEHGISRLNAQ